MRPTSPPRVLLALLAVGASEIMDPAAAPEPGSLSCAGGARASGGGAERGGCAKGETGGETGGLDDPALLQLHRQKEMDLQRGSLSKAIMNVVNVSVSGLGIATCNLLPSGVKECLNISFALPPTGKLRFQPPVPNPTWKNNHTDATKWGPKCIQFRGNQCRARVKEDEDCLQLNIWAPQASSDDHPFPVYVYIFGGGSFGGCAADFNGAWLAQSKSIVVVSVNYRLGVLGSFTSEELHDESSGGSYGGLQGAWDTLQAVKWVKQHIADFGGNPDEMTVGGESDGGMNACSHLFSPLARGVGVRRYAIQSAACNGPWAWLSTQQGIVNGQHCMHVMKAENLQALRSMDAAEIQKNCAVVKTQYPAIDGVFLPANPNRGNVSFQIDASQTKLLIGFDDRDGMSLAPPYVYYTDTDTWTKGYEVETLLYLLNGKHPTDGGKEALIQLLAEGTGDSEKILGFQGFGTQAARDIVQLYGDQPLPAKYAPGDTQWTRMLWAIQRDVQLTCPSVWLMDRFLAAGGQAAYLYWWWVPSYSGPKQSTPSAHGDEVPFLWTSTTALEAQGGCKDNCELAFMMQNRFGTFIKGEDPGPWQAFDPQLENYQNLSLPEPHMEQKGGLSVCKWWQDYISECESNFKTFMLFSGNPPWKGQ